MYIYIYLYVYINVTNGPKYLFLSATKPQIPQGSAYQQGTCASPGFCLGNANRYMKKSREKYHRTNKTKKNLLKHQVARWSVTICWIPVFFCCFSLRSNAIFADHDICHCAWNTSGTALLQKVAGQFFNPGSNHIKWDPILKQVTRQSRNCELSQKWRFDWDDWGYVMLIFSGIQWNCTYRKNRYMYTY